MVNGNKTLEVAMEFLALHTDKNMKDSGLMI